MKTRFISALIVAIGILLTTANASAQRMQQVFSSPESAMHEFGEAVKAKDKQALRLMLGDDYLDIIPAPTKEDYQRFIGAWEKAHFIVTDSPELAHIAVGDKGWTLPIPLAKTRMGWFFDMDAADEEIDQRTIGANELATIKAMLAYGDAQKEYAEKDRIGDGVTQYAQKLQSSPGKRDGLYWPTNADEPRSPIGEYFAQSKSIEGMENRGFYGYRFRILTRQGPAAPGGAKSYIEGGRMTGGYALIAWPIVYGETGVMTFIVNQLGEVYQKNLGANTAKSVHTITSYNPDKSWTKVSQDDL